MIGSRREARAIADLAGPGHARTILGFDVTREAVVSGDWQGDAILHFATHGVWDSARPLLSGLALSMVDAQGKLLLQSPGYASPKEAGQVVKALQQDDGALASLPPPTDSQALQQALLQLRAALKPD